MERQTDRQRQQHFDKCLVRKKERWRKGGRERERETKTERDRDRERQTDYDILTNVE